MKETTSELELAHTFYRALNAADVDALVTLLDPGFEGHVTEGLPAGLGGTYRGPEAMLRDAWRNAALIFHARPEPDSFFESDGGWIIIRGRYLFDREGNENAMDAAFAHFLRFDGERLVELWQVTDSRRWEQSLPPADGVT
jgi:2-(1,2-epoxy-1,2-dihydrophenyl)acetyl-CoA isomerase